MWYVRRAGFGACSWLGFGSKRDVLLFDWVRKDNLPQSELLFMATTVICLCCLVRSILGANLHSTFRHVWAGSRQESAQQQQEEKRQEDRRDFFWGWGELVSCVITEGFELIRVQGSRAAINYASVPSGTDLSAGSILFLG